MRDREFRPRGVDDEEEIDNSCTGSSGDAESLGIKAKRMFKGLVDLLSRCSVYLLQRDSQVYLLHRDDEKWFIATEFFPGQVVVHEIELSDPSMSLSFIPLLQFEGGNFDGL
jgi:hypothetical protein